VKYEIRGEGRRRVGRGKGRRVTSDDEGGFNGRGRRRVVLERIVLGTLVTGVGGGRNSLARLKDSRGIVGRGESGARRVTGN